MYSLIRNCKYGKWFTNDEIRMFCEIVRAAVHEAARRYPGCEFHAIFWDTENPTDRAAEFSRALQDAGCRVHLISDIIPDIETAMAGTYQIPHDNHPNPAAYRIMADYVARTIAKCDTEPR